MTTRNLSEPRTCNNCGKHAPESWSSGLCHDCYRRVGEENRRARAENEAARWAALRTRAEATEARVADLEAGLRALAAEWEAVAQTRPVADIGCPGGPGAYARDIQYRADALRALVGDEPREDTR